jgi:hypothetical protein
MTEINRPSISNKQDLNNISNALQFCRAETEEEMDVTENGTSDKGIQLKFCRYSIGFFFFLEM